MKFNLYSLSFSYEEEYSEIRSEDDKFYNDLRKELFRIYSLKNISIKNIKRTDNFFKSFL